MKYKSYRIIDGKPRWVIVNENGKIINKNPNKEELKGLEEEIYIKGIGERQKQYTDEELDYHIIRFFVENERIPVRRDFENNPEYPNFRTCHRRFGSWSNALKRVGLDVESMVKKGVIETNDQKARFAEMIIRNHFKTHPVDLAGENKMSPYDGICPNGLKYDVKSSRLLEHKGSLYHLLHTNNKYKEEIEIYYFLAFNEDYSKLEYAWRIPGWEVAEKDKFYIGTNNRSIAELTIENMKEYDITDKFIDILKKHCL